MNKLIDELQRKYPDAQERENAHAFILLVGRFSVGRLSDRQHESLRIAIAASSLEFSELATVVQLYFDEGENKLDYEGLLNQISGGGE